MAVRRSRGGGEVLLPADYVAEHVELAYATTAHRAQGRTVDSAHAMVSPTTTREVLYVAATRGRASNRLYVDVAYEPDPQTGHDGVVQPQTIRDVLAGVLANEGADISAHETLRRSQHEAESWAALHAEYQTIAKAAQADRWEALLERSGLGEEQLEQLHASEAHGPLVAAFQDAEARGLDIEAVFPQLVGARSLASAADPASVLHDRVDRWVEAAGSRRQAGANLIAGLVPRAQGITDPDMARALAERDQAMEQQARHLAEHALDTGAAWPRRLGPPPAAAAPREHWLRAVSTVAAYRDRWGIGNDNRPLGPPSSVTTIEHVGHRKRAQAALDRAVALSLSADDATSALPVRAVPVVNEMGGVGL